MKQHICGQITLDKLWSGLHHHPSKEDNLVTITKCFLNVQVRKEVSSVHKSFHSSFLSEHLRMAAVSDVSCAYINPLSFRVFHLRLAPEECVFERSGSASNGCDRSCPSHHMIGMRVKVSSLKKRRAKIWAAEASACFRPLQCGESLTSRAFTSGNSEAVKRKAFLPLFVSSFYTSTKIIIFLWWHYSSVFHQRHTCHMCFKQARNNIFRLEVKLQKVHGKIPTSRQWLKISE